MTNYESAHPGEQEPQLIDLEFKSGVVEMTLSEGHTYDDLMYTVDYCGVAAEDAEEKLDVALEILFNRNSPILGEREVTVDPRVNVIGATEPTLINFRPEVTYKEAVDALKIVCQNEEIARTKLRELITDAINRGCLSGRKIAFKTEHSVFPDSDAEIEDEMDKLYEKFLDDELG